MCLKIDPPNIVCVLCMTVYIDMKSCWGLLTSSLQIFYPLIVRISFNLELFFSNEFRISDFLMWDHRCESLCVYAYVCGCMQKSAQNSSSVIWVEVIFKCQKYISLVRFSPRNTRQKVKWWALKNILTFKLNKTFILIFLKTYFGYKMK